MIHTLSSSVGILYSNTELLGSGLTAKVGLQRTGSWSLRPVSTKGQWYLISETIWLRPPPRLICLWYQQSLLSGQGFDFVFSNGCCCNRSSLYLHWELTLACIWGIFHLPTHPSGGEVAAPYISQPFRSPDQWWFQMVMVHRVAQTLPGSTGETFVSKLIPVVQDLATR